MMLWVLKIVIELEILQEFCTYEVKYCLFNVMPIVLLFFMCFSTPGMPMSFTCSGPTLLMPWGSTTARRTRLFLSRQYEVDILCFKQNKKIVWFEFSLFAHAEQLMSSPVRRLPESLSTLSPKTQIHPLNSSQRMSWRKPSGEDQVREWLNTEYPKALSSAS